MTEFVLTLACLTLACLTLACLTLADCAFNITELVLNITAFDLNFTFNVPEITLFV